MVLAESEAGETVAVSGTTEVTVAGVPVPLTVAVAVDRLLMLIIADGIVPLLVEGAPVPFAVPRPLLAEVEEFCRGNSCLAPSRGKTLTDPGIATTVATKRH